MRGSQGPSLACGQRRKEASGTGMGTPAGYLPKRAHLLCAMEAVLVERSAQEWWGRQWGEGTSRAYWWCIQGVLLGMSQGMGALGRGKVGGRFS